MRRVTLGLFLVLVAQADGAVEGVRATQSELVFQVLELGDLFVFLLGRGCFLPRDLAVADAALAPLHFLHHLGGSQACPLRRRVRDHGKLFKLAVIQLRNLQAYVVWQLCLVFRIGAA